MKKLNFAQIVSALFLLSSCVFGGGGNSSASSSSSAGVSSSSSSQVSSSSDFESSSSSSSSSEHVHEYQAAGTDPTCTEEGYTTYTCSCGDSYKDDYVDALGHDLLHHEGADPTCTEEGYTGYDTCTRCDYAGPSESIPAKGHTYGEWIVDTYATCLESGSQHKECTDCNTVVDEKIPALGHDYVYHNSKAPTCEDAGWEAYETCSRCAYSTYKEIPARGTHNYGDWEIDTPATCTEAGSKHKTCSDCGGTVTETITASGHEIMQYEAKAPTCTEIGYEAYEACLNCDYSTYVEIAKLPHEYGYNSCIYCGWEHSETEGLLYFAITGEKAYQVVGKYTILGQYNIPVEIVRIQEKEVYIPSYNYAWPVTVIGDFEGCVAIENLYMPDTIEMIGASAFSGCTNLKKIVIPDSVTEIKEKAFNKCSSLASVEIGAGVTSLDPSVFFGCTSLSSISVDPKNAVYYSQGNCVIEKETKKLVLGCNGSVIPEDVTSIGDYAFQDSANLTSIVIPDSVTSIGQYSFKNCTGLTSVRIGSGVTSSYFNAFEGCNKLTELSLNSNRYFDIESLQTLNVGANVTSVSTSYASSENLVNITVDADNPKLYAEGNCVISKENKLLTVGCRGSIIPNGIVSIGNKAFYDCDQLTSVALPIGVTSIGQYAFAYSDDLASFSFPNSVDSVGAYAFYGCRALTNIALPNSVTSIGEYAFAQCTGLAEITIENSLTSVGDKMFDGTGNLKKLYYNSNSGLSSIISKITTLEEVTFGNNVTSIDDDVFANYKTLKKVTFSENLTSIGERAFYGCTSLESINIPDGVTSIGTRAFYNCSSLTGLDLPKSIVSIGTHAFYGCTNLERANIPNNLTAVNDYIFYGCYRLSNITIPENVTSIGSYAFYRCSNFSSITIPENVTSIGAYAFYSCSRLTSLNIPDSVTTIDKYAFAECVKLTSVNIGKNLDNISYNVFDGCDKVKELNLNANIFVSTLDSVETLNIGADVTYNITGYASYPNLANITVDPDNSTYYAEGNCVIEKKTKSVVLGCKNSVIPNDVTSISSFAFRDCAALTSINIPDNVTSISRNAFYGCSGLTSVTIGSGVTSIATQAFYGCSALENINISSENETYYSGSENNCVIETSTNKLLFGCKNGIIPDGVTSIGDSAFAGDTLIDSVNIPNSVTSIGDSAFYGCTSLTEIVFPHGVTSIGEDAFYECKAIANVSFSDTVTSIGANAFEACWSLVTVIIPDTVTTIGDYAFSRCGKLTIYCEASSSPKGYSRFWSRLSVTSTVPTYYYSATKKSGYWHYDSKGNIVLW